MSGTNTLDGMTVAQLRDLATRAENAAKQQEEKEKKKDKYTVSAAVEIDSYGTLVCAAKDGTRWYTARGGHWVPVDAGKYRVADALFNGGIFPYAYQGYTTFCAAHRPTYSGQVRK